MPGIANPIVSTAEVQTVTVDATGGTFTVTWNGATTSALAFDVSAATFTTAMDAVADGAGNVVVTGGPGAAGGGTPYTLTWSAGRGNVPAPTTDATSLTGGAGTAVVATTAAGVSALADPWLSVGAHAEPTTSVVPDRGDWQWCMMEVAAWMADESWTDDPANVSPIIADLCKALNDTLPDDTRQDLKDFLVAAPAGVIDTVDAGKETTRKLLCTNWLVRTYLPLWFDAAGMSDEADELAALPAIAAGTLDADETIAVIAAAGMAARAVAEYAWADLDWASLPGDGRADHPITGDFFPYLRPDLTTDYDFATLELAQRCSRGLAYDELGNDDGQAAWDAARRVARAAAWDSAGIAKALSWDSTRADPDPWLGVTGGTDADADTVALAAWQAARDAVIAAVTNGKLARDTYDVYEVRFASWLAYIGADASENAAAVAYEAAVAAADTILADVAEDVYDSLVTLLGALCAA